MTSVAIRNASAVVWCRKNPLLSLMHELSVASSIVEAVAESAATYSGTRVKQVRLRVGALASVVEDSLQFCWELATEGSPLAGAALVINNLPVIVHCAACGVDAEIEGIQNLRCPRCGELSADIRQGRELEIESIEIEEPEPKEAAMRVASPVEERI